MKSAIALVLMLSACAEERVDTLEYQCMLVTNCGFDKVFGTTIPVCGTYEEVAQFSNDWADACSAITTHMVQTRQCTYYVCAVICPASTAVEATCD